MGVSPKHISQTPALLAQLRLVRSHGFGPSSYQRLVNRYGSAEEAIAALEAAARKGTAHTQLADKGLLARELERADQLSVQYFFSAHATYPKRLLEIEDAPPVFMLRGNSDAVGRESLGVVGARNCSAAGAKLTRKLCHELGEAGLHIVSGLARGIDTAAHQGSVATGTTACMAGGCDIVYPRENTELYEEILEKGAIISELPLGAKPQARHFPRRNRLISGLSKGLIVIEAAKKSGSLITVRFAVEQNRDVFVIPGSPLDPRSQGSNQLIRDGAILVQSAEDILSEYDTMPLLRTVMNVGPEQLEAANNTQSKTDIRARTQVSGPVQSAAASSDIRTLLSPEPIHIDELARLSSQPIAALLTELTALEVSGEIMRHSGSRYSLISTKNE